MAQSRRFVATAVAQRFAELKTIAPHEYRQLCGKFASFFTGISRNEISGWLGLDMNRTAQALDEPLRYAQLAMLVPKLAGACLQLAELQELFRLLGDTELEAELQHVTAAAEEFKCGLNQALQRHKDERSKDCPELVDALIKLRTALKPTLAGVRAAYAQVSAVTITKATRFLTPSYQRKLPSAIPPMGRTIKVAHIEGTLQGLYQRLGVHADEVWAVVKPAIIGDLELLRRHNQTLTDSLRNAGLLFARM